MSDSLRLGRVRGISIGLHWSVAIFAAFISWNLARIYFPTFAPGHTGGTYLVAGLIAATLLAGSILAHELGHAIDVTHLHNGDREDWQDARQINGAPWWPDAYASDFQSGAGDFAEAFAYWALKDPSSSQIAGTPTPAQLAVLEQILSSRI